MKKFTTRQFLTAALAIACAVPAIAQPPAGAGGGGRGGNRLDFLAGYLSLTEAQKTQAQAIFDAASAASETARGTAQSAHEALQTAIKANASDTELDRLAAAAGAAHGQMTAIQAKAQAKFYALLTAEQKAKYDAMRERTPGDRTGNGFGAGRSRLR
ncbi:MAG: Spy/CpxP family protein refolding chaperone [Bryobacteraceae bacterium]|nr:Spy/CpxP family protein refolding chaperone [Bryobacteraceae bacterium]